MVTFDTQSLIWGVQKVATPGQEHMIDWTARLIEDIKGRVQFVITAVALGEYLTRFNEAERQAQLSVVHRDFMVLPYDARAASIAADLWRQRHQPDVTSVRNVIKADIAILATAIAGGAQTIYSHDKQLRSLASVSGEIIAKKIPDPDANTLFGAP